MTTKRTSRNRLDFIKMGFLFLLLSILPTKYREGIVDDVVKEVKREVKREVKERRQEVK